MCHTYAILSFSITTPVNAGINFPAIRQPKKPALAHIYEGYNGYMKVLLGWAHLFLSLVDDLLKGLPNVTIL